MNQNSSRSIRAGLGVAAGAAALLVALAPTASASPLFCGAGRSLTADGAVNAALDDAQTSAQSMGFYGACTIVGEPQIFETFNDPNYGHIFRAQVNATCEE